MSSVRGSEISIRMARVAAYLLYGGELTSKTLMEKFGFSKAQAGRVLLMMETEFPQAIVEHRPYGTETTASNFGKTFRVLRLPESAQARAA